MKRIAEFVIAAIGLIVLALLLPTGWTDLFPGAEDLEE